MGIRVSKKIGYYLSKKSIPKVLAKDYEEKLDYDYMVPQDLIKKVIMSVQNIGIEYPQIDTVYPVIVLKELLTQEDLCIDQFVQSIMNYDTFKGILFLTPQLDKYGRYDDLIDYYEESKTPKFKLKLLKQTIYPDCYYVCLKTPPISQDSMNSFKGRHNSHIPLERGHSLMLDDLRWLMISNGINFEYDKPNIWAYPKKDGEKYFHPYVNIMTYAFAKELGILKAGVSYIDFIQYLEPAIVTSWG